jgi:5-methylcytosine-specific restriction endonuclease McrA
MCDRHVERAEPCEICAADAVYIAEIERLEGDARRKLAEAFKCALERFDGDVARAFEWLAYELQSAELDTLGPRSATPRPKCVIPKTLRWEVFKRDDFHCKHCGTRDNLSVDHIHPESAGGTLELDNLQTLCRACNSRKGARHS